MAYYDGIAPSFEALMKEFVINPIALDPKSRENRRSKIYGYWKNIYADTQSVNATYKKTRDWASKVFAPKQSGARPAFPKYPDEQIDVWSEPQKERKSTEVTI
jgi:hypothetical protein